MAKPADILLIEDNINDVELTLHAFQKNNLINKVQVIRDGAEALEYLFCHGRYSRRQKEDTPLVILLDLKLPLVDGLEVLRQIKGDEQLKCIPVTVLTASREEPDIQLAYELGANSYVVKPVNFNQFMEVSRTLGLYWLMINEPPIRPNGGGLTPPDEP